MNYNTITAIILAAGSGRRIGNIPKWKLKYNDKYLLEIIYDKLIISGICNISCVVNCHFNLKFQLNNIHYIVNHVPKLGMISSIYKAIEHNSNNKYYMIFPVDHPFVSQKTITKLREYTINKNNIEILKPIYNNITGHPIIISNNIAKKIPKIYENGLRAFISENKINILTLKVDDENILTNINTNNEIKKYKLYTT